jgi:hypothetical protein
MMAVATYSSHGGVDMTGERDSSDNDDDDDEDDSCNHDGATIGGCTTADNDMINELLATGYGGAAMYYRWIKIYRKE